MLRYLLRRLLALIPVLILVSLISFTLVHLTPGDPVAQILGDDATVDEIERVRHDLGLDRPVYEQYLIWVGDALRGDLGQSIYVNQPVTSMIIERAEPTLMLAIVALFFTLIIGIPSGVIAAIKHNSYLDQSLMLLALLAVSMPNFWLGLNLILLFSVYIGWFPTGGYTPLGESVVGAFKSVMLPAIALGFSQAALVARMTRASMLDVIRTDYVRTARAKGLPASRVYITHALKNALLPTITVIGLVLTVLIGGTVVTETVFTIPGAGRLVVNSVIRRDYPVIQGAIMMVATAYVLINLVIDLIYVYVDPRIRLS
ncbi:MAG TPA: ABC transporter permease [Thermomicrobiales bacterium]|nr:ABC transporter permease [Thermomicrobiales bacterium]